MLSETYLRKALANTKTKYASLEDEHSLLKDKHSLLEKEHADMKSKHTKLQEEHAELHHERNDMESEAWFRMMEKQDVQDEYKKLQDEHAQWKAACASLVKEVERKVLEKEYMAQLAQQYGQTRWSVAKVADLEAELERKLADAQQLAKEWEQALTDKVAALESEVANLSSAVNKMRADFTKSHLASEETTDGLVKELAEAKTETVQHVEANKRLRSQMTALLTSAKTAVTSWEAASTKKKRVDVEATKIVKVPTQTQPRCAQRREVELTKTGVRLGTLKLSGETTVRSKSTTKRQRRL
uniref:Uncharacterized protein n=1 Tax=Phytophthora ramorum TaxID=164328 RepID=H3GMY2_PHYRM